MVAAGSAQQALSWRRCARAFAAWHPAPLPWFRPIILIAQTSARAALQATATRRIETRMQPRRYNVRTNIMGIRSGMQPDPSQGSLAVRSVSQWERALLARWFAGTDRTGAAAIAAAYVSERSRDDPRLRNMIVVAEHGKHDVAYLIHHPLGETAWTVTCGRTGIALGHFRTLPEALNMIRPARVISVTQPIAEAHRSVAWLAESTNGQ
jgi:hypothetical protein